MPGLNACMKRLAGIMVGVIGIPVYGRIDFLKVLQSPEGFEVFAFHMLHFTRSGLMANIAEVSRFPACPPNLSVLKISASSSLVSFLISNMGISYNT